MGVTYEIKTVADFLQVPADRQADCLAEFADFLGMARAVIELAEICAEVIGVNAGGKVDTFIWIDDGKRDKTVTIRAEEKGGEGRELDVADCAVTLEEARGVIRRMEKRIAKLENEKIDWVAVGKG